MTWHYYNAFTLSKGVLQTRYYRSTGNHTCIACSDLNFLYYVLIFYSLWNIQVFSDTDNYKIVNLRLPYVKLALLYSWPPNDLIVVSALKKRPSLGFPYHKSDIDFNKSDFSYLHLHGRKFESCLGELGTDICAI